MEVFLESVTQKEKFRIAANKLLNQCFLLKKYEATKDEYIFVIQHRAYFSQYFDLLGYELQINEQLGVIALTNNFGTGRLGLKKGETILLLIFRLLFIEKKKELSQNSETVVLMEEVQEKYSLLKVKNRPSIDKTLLRDSIRLFKRYNLLQPLDSDVTQGDCRIRLLPSLMFALDNEDVGSYYDGIMKKTQQYINGGKIDDDETTDED